MEPGRLRERVTLMEPVVTKDIYGAEQTTYTASRTVWAEVQWKSGSTIQQVGEMFMDERIDVIIRIQHPVAEGWRVKQLTMNKNLFHIRAIEPNQAKGLNRLICERVNE